MSRNRSHRVSSQDLRLLVAAFAAAALAACLPASLPARAPGTPRCQGCPPLAVVPAGSFAMGRTVDRGYGPIDGPTHTVKIAAPFALAVHEVTVGEFRRFVEDTGHVSAGRCNIYRNGSNWFIDPERSWADPGFAQADDHPVVCVTWRDTQAYLAWLERRTGRKHRLPSEAEWEYAAGLADLGNTRAGGKLDHELANLGRVDCCGGAVAGRDRWLNTAPVGSFPADRLGLHDLRGNVWEWQQDCYHADYVGAPTDGSARENCPGAGYRVVRGGSYGDNAEYLSERFRLRGPEDQAYFTVGFRVASEVEVPAQ